MNVAGMGAIEHIQLEFRDIIERLIIEKEDSNQRRNVFRARIYFVNASQLTFREV